ncbi:MAG: helix-turn-helix domain-containing protein [Victivallaceae bacterium]
MNNLITDTPPLVLELVNRAPLWANWRNCRLAGHHWRLYLHDAPGAGVWLNDRKKPLLPGRCYLLPPDCNLRAWCDEMAVNQLYIHFEVSESSGSPQHLCNELAPSPLLDTLAARIFAGPGVDHVAALALAAAAFSLLPPEARPRRDSAPELTGLVNLMRSRLAAELDLDAFCRRLGISVNTLIRRFRSAYGSTPCHYLTTMRYSVAARLLEENRLSIDEICEQIGVKDRFHFSRMFRRRYGLPPGRYRDARIPAKK